MKTGQLTRYVIHAPGQFSLNVSIMRGLRMKTDKQQEVKYKAIFIGGLVIFWILIYLIVILRK